MAEFTEIADAADRLEAAWQSTDRIRTARVVSHWFARLAEAREVGSIPEEAMTGGTATEE